MGQREETFTRSTTTQKQYVSHIIRCNTTFDKSHHYICEKLILYMVDNAVIINKVHTNNAEHSVIETIEW